MSDFSLATGISIDAFDDIDALDDIGSFDDIDTLKTATFYFAPGDVSTGTEFDSDLSTSTDLFSPSATGEADIAPTISSEEDIPGRFELFGTPDGRGGSKAPPLT